MARLLRDNGKDWADFVEGNAFIQGIKYGCVD
jgi:hypothetical protein